MNSNRLDGRNWTGWLETVAVDLEIVENRVAHYGCTLRGIWCVVRVLRMRSSLLATLEGWHARYRRHPGRKPGSELAIDYSVVAPSQPTAWCCWEIHSRSSSWLPAVPGTFLVPWISSKPSCGPGFIWVRQNPHFTAGIEIDILWNIFRCDCVFTFEFSLCYRRS